MASLWHVCAQTATFGDATDSDLSKVTLQFFFRQCRDINENVFSGGYWFFFFLKYVLLNSERNREEERERNSNNERIINRLPSARPILGIKQATLACVLSGNGTQTSWFIGSTAEPPWLGKALVFQSGCSIKDQGSMHGPASQLKRCSTFICL